MTNLSSEKSKRLARELAEMNGIVIGNNSEDPDNIHTCPVCGNRHLPMGLDY